MTHVDMVLTIGLEDTWEVIQRKRSRYTQKDTILSPSQNLKCDPRYPSYILYEHTSHYRHNTSSNYNS